MLSSCLVDPVCGLLLWQHWVCVSGGVPCCCVCLCADACDEKESHEWWPVGRRGCISLYSLRHQHPALTTPAHACSAGPMHHRQQPLG